MNRRNGLQRMVLCHMVTILVIMMMAISFVVKGAGNEMNVNGGELYPHNGERVLQSGCTTLTEELSKQEMMQTQELAESQVEPETENLTVVSEKPEWALRITTQERYYLAKIVMCEAEGESDITKALIAMVVINRVESPHFPNTVWDVLSQESNGVYQFSPLAPMGSWNRKEPDDSCYRVIDMLMAGEIADTSEGALYFEACSETDNWHSRNLEYLFDSDNTRFYR